MTDSTLRSLERAVEADPHDREAAARLIEARIRAGGRDPRRDPRKYDVVQERRVRASQYLGARVVLGTWPRLISWEVTALPMTAEGGEAGAAALRAALDQRSLSLGRLVPGARVLHLASVVRRPRAGQRGWDRVEVQTSPGVWATYQVEAEILTHRTETTLDLRRHGGGLHLAPPAEEVEWQSYSLHDTYSHPDQPDREEHLRRYGRSHHSPIHAWRDWCRGDSRVVRLGEA